MIKIKFLNEKDFRDVEFIKNNDHIVTLKGLTEVNLSGFRAFNHLGNVLLGDYSDFTYCYNILEDGILLCNDGSTIDNPVIYDSDNASLVSLLASNWKDEIEARLFYIELMTGATIDEDVSDVEGE